MANVNFIVTIEEKGERIIVTIENPFSKKLRVLKWNTVLDFPYVHGFTVKTNKDSLEYTGPYFKRVFMEESLIEFDANQKIEIGYDLTVILNEFETSQLADEGISIAIANEKFLVLDETTYSKIREAQYYEVDVQSNQLLLEKRTVDDCLKKKDSQKEDLELFFDPLSMPICVFGHNDGYEQLGPMPRHTVGYPLTSNLSKEQKQKINVIIKETYTFFAFRFRSVENNELYRKWFGVFSEENQKKVNNVIRSLKHGACPSYIVLDGSRTSLCTTDTYAFIQYRREYNEHPKQCSSVQHFCHRIFLCSLFWTRPLKGEDSQIGTMLHEFSHGYGYTVDHVYGKVMCRNLARNNSNLAVENADNFQYYIEELL